MEDVLRDKRFAHIAKDPRFRKMPRGERKVKIDSRFKEMFSDKRFKLKYSVDKRGRPVNLTTNENLKKFYELSSEGSEDDDDNSGPDKDDGSDENGGKKVIKIAADDDGGGDKDEGSSDEEGSLDEEGSCDSEEQNEENSESEYSEEEDDEEKTVNKSQKSKPNKVTDPRFQIPDSKAFTTKPNIGDKKKKAKQIGDKKKRDNVKAETEKKTNKKKEKLEATTRVKKSKSKMKSKPSKIESEESSSDESEEETQVKSKGDIRIDSGVDFARGEGNLSSSSSEEDNDVDDVVDDDELDHHWGEADPNVTEVSEATHRLAACNLDWDRVKVKDIFVLLNSFKPANGIITSVKIYPSEFGKERMEEEKSKGPRVLTEMQNDTDDEDRIEDKHGNEYHTERLRQYQLERLKYYYAIVDCDTKETAEHIYKECDGMEYETSCTKIDLRFIPDDMEFDEEPSSVCTEMPSEYKPMQFVNTALSQSKVDLTWDETDRERVQLTIQQFSNKPEDMKDDDLKAYLASSSDEDAYGALQDMPGDESGDDDEGEDKEEKQINKYKQLLTELGKEESRKNDRDVQMEITWEPGLKGATEDLIKKKKNSKELTPWEDYLVKKKEKKKLKKGERKKKKTSSDEEDDGSDQEVNKEDEGEDGQAFSDDELPGNIDMNDPFFAEEMQSRDKGKKDKKKKKKKKEEKEVTEEDVKEQAELSLLIMDETDEKKKHYNLKKLVEAEKQKKKKKGKNKDKGDKSKEDNFQVNLTDPRFSAMYDSHLFNIDPSVPEYKKTKGTEAIIAEKLKRSDIKGKKKRSDTDGISEAVKKRKMDEGLKSESLASLVKSVKSKTKHFQSNRIKR